MTVKITKPEINVREKLNELDFAKLPFQKMPSGSVVQQKVVIRQADVSTGANTSDVDLMAFKFKPKFAGSRLEFFMNLSVGAHANMSLMFKLVNSTTGAELERTGTHINGDTNTDAMNTRFSWYHLHDPQDTEEYTYQLKGRKITGAAGTVWFHTYGASNSSFFGVREIKDGAIVSTTSL